MQKWQMGKIVKNVISLRGKKHRKERAKVSERERVRVFERMSEREKCE